MHAEAVGPKGLYDGARHLCKVVPQPQGLGDLAHPLLRHRRQPPQHIFALLQLLPVLKQALLAQELRRAITVTTALSANAALPALLQKEHCTCKTSCMCCSWRGSKDAGQALRKVVNCARSAVSQDWHLPHRSQEERVSKPCRPRSLQSYKQATETPLSHHAAQAASLRTASKSSLCFLSLSVGGVRLIGFTNSPILSRVAAPSTSLPVLSCDSSQQSPAAPPAHVLATEPDLAADLVPSSTLPSQHRPQPYLRATACFHIKLPTIRASEVYMAHETERELKSK